MKKHNPEYCVNIIMKANIDVYVHADSPEEAAEKASIIGQTRTPENIEFQFADVMDESGKSIYFTDL